MDSRDLGDPREDFDGAGLTRLTHSMKLVRKLRRGDRAAMNELLERYGPRIERVVSVKLNAHLRRHIDPADIVQEVLLIAAQKIGDIELRSEASIFHWLAQIAVHRIQKKVDYYTAMKRNARGEVPIKIDSDDVFGVRVEAVGPTPSAHVRGEEMREVIDGFIAELGDEERKLLELRDEEELDWEEIRERFGRPTVGAVRELYRRTKKKLVERIERHFDQS